MWTMAEAASKVYAFDQLTDKEQQQLLDQLNSQFEPELFEKHLKHRRDALDNLVHSRNVLSGVTQCYPAVLNADELNASAADLDGYAIVFTAGGDGERLRLSLEEQGVDAESLADFTKATYQLPDFFEDFGALHINLCVVADICREHDLDIPVVITTGPEGSVTARVIPAVLEKYNNFGLKNVEVVRQDERLHFTVDERIAYTRTDDGVALVTHPDESGGPIVKLSASGENGSPLDNIEQAGCSKVIILQGTAVYDPKVIFSIASASKKYDGLGVGIARSEFSASDPYGTYVALDDGSEQRVVIVEQDIRNEQTLSLVNQNQQYLPYNTGFYAFAIEVLRSNKLPDYATPPKQVCPGLAKSAKIGYAATDILPMAKSPAVLTISSDSYGVIKNADDLEKLSSMARSFGLDLICRRSIK